MSTNVEPYKGRDIVLMTGEVLDVFEDASPIAAYLENLTNRIKDLAEERGRVEAAVLRVMDEALQHVVQFQSGALEKDPPGKSRLDGWDDQVLATLFDDEYLPPEGPARERYQRTLNEVLRPTVVYQVDAVKLKKLAKERPDIAGVIADAERRLPSKRRVHVRRG